MFLLVWENYALATELNKKSEPVQVATLLTLTGEEAREVYSTFNTWRIQKKNTEDMQTLVIRT